MKTTPIEVPEDFTLTVHGHTIGAETLYGMSPSAIAYLIGNGFSQSITDAAAFSKADKEGKSEAEVATMAAEARQKRYDAILAGTVGTAARGPRLKGLDAVIYDVAVEIVRAAPAFTTGVGGKPALKWSDYKADQHRAWVEQYLARGDNRVRVTAEAQRRIDSRAESDDFDPSAPTA